MNTLILILAVALTILPRTGFTQNVKSDCESNIELLRRDMLSMLDKIPAMPPVAQVYTAAKERFTDLNNMKNSGKYSECVSESERVLRITRPYGNRR